MTDHPASHASPPLLLLMKGHPASGKSRLARLIAASFKMALSDKDDSRDCFHAAEEQFGSAAAWDLNALSYQVMFRVASTQLACGNSVVIDCPLSKLELYQQAKSLADKHFAAVAVIECQPRQLEVWRGRLEARICQEHSSHKPTSWAALKSLIDKYNGGDEWSVNGSVEIGHLLLLDTSSGTSEDHLAQVASFLSDKRLTKS